VDTHRRLWKPVDIVTNLENASSSATWVRIYLDFRALFYFAHWVGCLWWGLGQLEYACLERTFNLIADEGSLPSADLLASLNMSVSDALEHFDDHSAAVIKAATDACGEGVPWVLRTDTRDLPAAPVLQKYVTSLYWSIATIVRNPWVAPDTQYEKCFTSAIIVFGTVLFALIIGSVNAMVRTYDEASASRRRRLASIRVFMAFHGLPQSLQMKMLSYAEGDWQMTAGIDMAKAVAGMPAVLRSSVLMSIHTDLRNECPLFQGLPRECISLLVAQLQPQLCLQGEPLIEPGQLLWELFMLRRGSLSIKRATAEGLMKEALIADTDSGSAGPGKKKKEGTTRRRRMGQQDNFFRILDKPGQYVGLVHPFKKPPRAMFRISAIKQCQLLRITQSTLWEVLSHFGPEVQERFCEALRDHYDATLAALKLPAYEEPSHSNDGQGGAFTKSCGGCYAVEERIELQAAGSMSAAGGSGRKGISVMQKNADVREASTRIEELQQAVEMCEERAAALQVTAASLPSLSESLLRVQQTLMKRPRLPYVSPDVMSKEPKPLLDEERQSVGNSDAEKGKMQRKGSKFFPQGSGGSGLPNFARKRSRMFSRTSKNSSGIPPRAEAFGEGNPLSV
jgi:CRP-like cAMP-binding protein